MSLSESKQFVASGRILLSSSADGSGTFSTGFENKSVNSVAVSKKKGKVSTAHEVQSQLL